MPRGIEHGVVHTHADGGVGVAARRGDHDPPDAPTEVLRRVLAAGEDAGGLDHHVDVVVGPGNLARVGHTEARNVAVVDGEPVLARRDRIGQRATDRVVLEQERHGLVVAHGVVDRHQLDRGVRPTR